MGIETEAADGASAAVIDASSAAFVAAVKGEGALGGKGCE